MYKNNPDSSEFELNFSKESIDFDLFFVIIEFLAKKIRLLNIFENVVSLIKTNKLYEFLQFLLF